MPFNNNIMLNQIFTLLIVLFFANCKPSQNRETKKETKETNNKNTESVTLTDSSIYSLVASFYSRGEGIDFKVANEYKTFLLNYKTSNELALEHDIISWGREGETDFCIRFNNLSEKDKRLFLEKSQEILKKTDRVNIKENASCRKKRTN